jgi:hypothetical protein
MTAVSRYGRDLLTVFDLLGRHEPALTGALGWTLATSPGLMSAVLERVGLKADADEVSLKLETADDHGRTDIELSTPAAHVIVEAKQGWLVPGEVQLRTYTHRFSGDHDQRLVTLSDSTERWAREVLPADVAGVPVEHWSWDDVRDLVRTARTHARGTERLWLDQLEEYMGEATSKRPVTDSLTYCVVISEQRFGGISFRDHVQHQRVYFHPFALRRLNRVVDYEIVAHLDDRFPSVTREEFGGPHVVYRLGPDIPSPGARCPVAGTFARPASGCSWTSYSRSRPWSRRTSPARPYARRRCRPVCGSRSGDPWAAHRRGTMSSGFLCAPRYPAGPRLTT